MDTIIQRVVYPTAIQKRKLLELMAKHPELVSCKVTSDFNHKAMQRLWLNIANECNAIEGAKKTWQQWRKTWQDMKAKMKKKQANKRNGVTASVVSLTTAEQEALGFKNVSSTTANYQETMEFVPLDVNIQENYESETGFNASCSFSEPESPPEVKIFAQPQPDDNTLKTNKKLNSEHAQSCLFNCDMMAKQEQKKLQLKQDYYNFKQDYLRQKLLIMKEQTEALKSIAKELGRQ